MKSEKETPEQTFEKVPKGYTCTPAGLKQIADEGDPVWVTLKPVIVKAASRDENGESHGLLVWWRDIDNKEHEMAIPKRLIHAQGTDAALQLIDGGLPVVHGKEKALLRYLSVFSVKDRLIAATCTGWMGESFVLPNEVINQPKGQKIVYQPPGGVSNTAKAIKRGGSFSDWKKGMADVSQMVVFEVCLSLSAPVRFKANVEAGGFHVYTGTSQGKTTILQAGASVWGSGVDPAIAGGGEAYIQRWNRTANALEATAEIYNDIYFPIDEVGEGDSREFGRTIYRVFSGTGRGRANRDGGLRDSKTWRITIGSAGEIGVADFIESGGGHVKGGQLVRMIDVDLASIKEPLFSDGKEANAMKELCSTHYGHAGPEMLKAIPDIAGEWESFDKTKVGDAYTPIAERARDRFALVAYTGVIAVRAGILPWTEEDVMDSVKDAYSVWHAQINTVGDIDRGVKAVKDFIEMHAARFESSDDYTPRDRVGWKRGEYYHFSNGGFKEACDGGDDKKIRQALKDAGLLHTSHGNKSRIRLKGVTKPVSVTSVDAKILSTDHTDHIGESAMGSAGTRTGKGLNTPITPITPENDDLDLSEGKAGEKLMSSKSDVISVNSGHKSSVSTDVADHMGKSVMGSVGSPTAREEI